MSHQFQSIKFSLVTIGNDGFFLHADSATYASQGPREDRAPARRTRQRFTAESGSEPVTLPTPKSMVDADIGSRFEKARALSEQPQSEDDWDSDKQQNDMGSTLPNCGITIDSQEEPESAHQCSSLEIIDESQSSTIQIEMMPWDHTLMSILLTPGTKQSAQDARDTLATLVTDCNYKKATGDGEQEAHVDGPRGLEMHSHETNMEWDEEAVQSLFDTWDGIGVLNIG
ncbi:hypothetical protein B0T10DRAFT_575801 [Thelonectria olida]|uniref:Uncharacterized protein n=1 Tax=Thelonectria olida TaxID=1576542 RepID=A0A9P9AN26_9HYPO|nr:hypothetical protein B0T10DRAFT_575801 [Thelonectria olida]